jgi:malate dehydrogenase (quinone)
VGLRNTGLVKYLVGELVASPAKKLAALREFMPTAEAKDWYLITAGQRVQVMKKDAKKGGVLQFGTEIVCSADGTIAGLLGASPGASVSVSVMLDVLKKCFPTNMASWQPQLEKMIPSFGTLLSAKPAAAKKSLAATAKVLELSN